MPTTQPTNIKNMNLSKEIKAAGANGKLLPASVNNIISWIEANFLPPWAISSLEELVNTEDWDELNARFYQSLSFGTGGLRGRTIGKQITPSEKGQDTATSSPAHPSVGTAYLNDFNIIRATIGLHYYCKKAAEHNSPSLVIAHDVRFFSRHFCELAASTWSKLGGKAYIFPHARSTPQLSFQVRHLAADAGVIITASHNPFHDNGYKVYCSDGGQIVPPHSEGIIQAIDNVPLGTIARFLDKETTNVLILSEKEDDAYLDAIVQAVGHSEKNELLEKKLECPLRVVFTPLHGVGAVAAIPLMEQAGYEVHTVEEQMRQDGRFPSIALANPEHPEAFSLALKKAKATKADLALATDPDADRLGVALPDPEGHWVRLTGNQIGAMLLAFRVHQLKEEGILTPKNAASIAVIKTFVTTPFADAIAAKHGIKKIDTLTGFKWAGAKLQAYEATLCRQYEADQGQPLDYKHLEPRQRRDLLIRYSTYCVLVFEESYGLLVGDVVRDKDANAGALLVCQMADHLRTQGKTLFTYLDSLYLEYGSYFAEDLVNLQFEGPSGMQDREKILKAYADHPPKQIAGHAVTAFYDFNKGNAIDADGEPIPHQAFYSLELANGYRYAIRASGTEPKLKCYLFARELVSDAKRLPEVKARAAQRLETLAKAVEAEVRERL